MKRKAIFLDKDGTIIENTSYQCDEKCIHILPGVIQGLSLLKELGFIFIIVTNQSSIAKKIYSENKLLKSLEFMKKIFSLFGIPILDSYYCPHSSDLPSSCSCRKPKIQMILEAQKKHNIDLSNSWMIGDILNDIECGNKAHCKTILVDNGNETEWKIAEKRKPTYVVNDFLMASFIIAGEITDVKKNIYIHNARN